MDKRAGLAERVRRLFVQLSRVGLSVGAREEFQREGLTLSPCNLCPRMCHADRAWGGVGVCGAGKSMKAARAGLHFWEEPPLSGASGSGAVFFAHCSLRCVYCQNREIAAGGSAYEISPQKLAQTCVDLQNRGALNVNFVTPTHFAVLVAEAVELAREAGLTVPVVWNTSGYERVEVVKALGSTVDVYLADFKYAASDRAVRYSNAPDYPETALAAIDQMALETGPPAFDVVGGQQRMTRGVIVRHLLLPGGLDDSKAALSLLHERFGQRVRYSLMNQYTPMLSGGLGRRFPELTARASDADYEELLDFADDLGIEDYYWQVGQAASESFIPEWDGSGIR